MVWSLDSFLIVCHALRLLCVRSAEVMTSSKLFFFSSFILSINVFPVSMVVSPKGSSEYCFLGSSSVLLCCTLSISDFYLDLFMTDLFVCSCRTWSCLHITRFYEEQRQPPRGSVWPAGPKKMEVSTKFAWQFVVVCFPRLREGMARLHFSDILTELPVPPQASRVVGTFYVLFIIYHSVHYGLIFGP